MQLRDLMHQWHEALTRQNEVALKYIDALRKGETGRKEVIADLLRINSDHMDTIQDAITDLVNDSDFDIHDR